MIGVCQGILQFHITIVCNNLIRICLAIVLYLDTDAFIACTEYCSTIPRHYVSNRHKGREKVRDGVIERERERERERELKRESKKEK